MPNHRMLSRRDMLKLLGATGASVVALAACAPTVPTPGVGEEAAAPGEQERIELRYMDRGDALGEFMRHASRVYEEQNPHIVVKNESTGWGDLTTKVPTFVAAGTMADLAFQHNAFMLPELAKKGAWLNVEPLAEADGHDFAIYYPFAVDALRLGPQDELIAMPMGIHFGENDVMWNVEMLQEFGLPEPSAEMSLDEFEELLILVQEKMPEGGFAADFSKEFWGMEAHSRSFGGYIISNDRTQCGFDLPETRDAHQWMIDLIHQHQVVPSRDKVLESGKSMFYTGMLAIISNTAPNVWVGFQQATEGRFTLGHTVWPHGDGGKVGITPSVDATVIYAQTKYPDEAWGLAKLLSSFEISKWAAMHENHMTPGAVIEAWHDPEVWEVNPPYKNLALFWDTLTPEDAGSVPVPANTRKGEFWDLYNNEWTALREGDKPFDEANISKLDADLQAIMDKPVP
ncbi:MAG TPA: extracellular solute-binding protein [Caldilineaceae bacterium]|nr:extracellular solute-binding protein [Caldilineaceae bacterium]